MLDVIITVHDQQIIIDFEKVNKYRNLPKYRYAFVGQGECNLIRNLPNVVIVRELADNIEHYKHLVDFTAWYAIARNDLTEGDFVALLQYDTAISTDFYEKTVECITTHPDRILGYQEWPILDENFIDNNMGYKPLADALYKVYGVDLRLLVDNYVAGSTDRSWPSSNNLAMSRGQLARYIDWITPMIDLLGPDVYSGHSVERSVKIYCIINNISNIYPARLVHHYQLNSHGTQGFAVDFTRELARVANNELPKKGKSSFIDKIRRFLAGPF